MNEFMLANLKELEFARRKNLGLVYGEQAENNNMYINNGELSGLVDWKS
jgi:hypothetical protein